jgi:putative SOS response-associated peptidase YedK
MKNRETGERLKSCTVIVGEPNGFAAEIHDRMPVFLTAEQFAPWLSGEAGAEFLKREVTWRNIGVLLGRVDAA